MATQLAATQTPKQGTRLKSFGSAERYLSGVLWTIAMYTDGHVPDFTFLFTNLNAPAASTLDAYMHDLMHMTSHAHDDQRSAVEERARPQCRRRPLCRSPRRLSVRHYCPSRACGELAPDGLARELEPGGSLAFLVDQPAKTAQAPPPTGTETESDQPNPRASSPGSSKSTKPVRPVPNSTRPSPSSSKSTSPPPSSTNSTKLPPLDYERALRAAAALPAELVSRAQQLSQRHAWLRFTTMPESARGSGGGRGGRGGGRDTRRRTRPRRTWPGAQPAPASGGPPTHAAAGAAHTKDEPLTPPARRERAMGPRKQQAPTSTLEHAANRGPLTLCER